MTRPCFFFRVPDMAPRTLCVCQCRALLICSTVAPSDRRSMASSCSSLVLVLRGGCFERLAGARSVFVAALFPLVIIIPLHCIRRYRCRRPCIRSRCPEPPVERRIMPLRCSLQESHSMAASGAELRRTARLEGARSSAPNDKLRVRQRWLILVALTVLSWALIGGIAIAVVAVVRHLDW